MFRSISMVMIDMYRTKNGRKRGISLIYFWGIRSISDQIKTKVLKKEKRVKNNFHFFFIVDLAELRKKKIFLRSRAFMLKFVMELG